MRSGQRPISLQCLALGDSRLALRGTTPATALSLRRSYHKSLPLDNKTPRYPVYKNSLTRTLEAQRVANRESVVRKVYSAPPPDQLINGEKQENSGEEQENNGAGLQAALKGAAKVKRFDQTQKGPQSKYQQLSDLPNRSPWVAKGRGLVQWPWLEFMRDGQGINDDALSRLGSEISALAKYLKPSADEWLVVDSIRDDISKTLQGIVPSSLQLIGSRSTQTASTNSDVNLMIRVNDTDRPHHMSDSMSLETTQDLTAVMEAAEFKMRDSKAFHNIRLVRAKNPALVMSHKASDLTIKLCFRSKLPAADDFKRDHITRFPSLQPLYMVMRVLLERSNRFGWESYVIGPYSLFLLITSVVKQGHYSPEESSPKLLGEQLLAILHTYGSKIDLTTTGVSVDPAGFFTTSSISEDIKLNRENGIDVPPYLLGQQALMQRKIYHANGGILSRPLCIQDPQNYFNDVGRHFNRTRTLQGALLDYHHRLESALQQWNDDGIPDYYRGILGQVLPNTTNFDDLASRKKRILSH